MKLRKLVLLPAAAALVGFGSMAQASIWDGSFTDLGVNYSLSFDSLVGSTGTFTLTLDTSGYSQQPQNLAYLDSVDIKAWGDNVQSGPLFSLTNAPTSGTDPNKTSTWNTSNSSINNGNSDCSGNSAGFACAVAATKGVFNVGPTYQFVFSVTAQSASDFLTSVYGAHVGAGYANALGDGAGYGITSVTMIPEPETYAMLLAGLGLMAFVARRRRESLGNLVPA